MSNSSKEFEEAGVTGKLYGITVLPANFEEWADECAKRKVSREENLDVMLYLHHKASQELVREARIDEANWWWESLEYATKDQADRLKELSKLKGGDDE